MEDGDGTPPHVKGVITESNNIQKLNGKYEKYFNVAKRY